MSEAGPSPGPCPSLLFREFPYPYSNKISKIDTIVPKISEKNLKFQQEEPWLSRNDIESYLNKLFRSNWGQKRSFRPRPCSLRILGFAVRPTT